MPRTARSKSGRLLVALSKGVWKGAAFSQHWLAWLGQGNRTMLKNLALATCVASFATSCSVSVSPLQLEQHGFYSESLTREQVQAARDANRVKSLGRFDIPAMGCGEYTSSDDDIVRPAVLKQLHEMGGNAAENVALHDRPANFFVGLLVVPVVAGCRGFEITGNALKVEPGS